MSIIVKGQEVRISDKRYILPSVRGKTGHLLRWVSGDCYVVEIEGNEYILTSAEFTEYKDED